MLDGCSLLRSREEGSVGARGPVSAPPPTFVSSAGYCSNISGVVFLSLCVAVLERQRKKKGGVNQKIMLGQGHEARI